MFTGSIKWNPAGMLRALTWFVLCWEAALGASPSVRVAWDPNPEANIKGYRIYYGAAQGGSTNIVDVGKQTIGTITNLAFATSYFFYVTAYNVFDLESDPSEKLYYTTPAMVPLSLSTDGYLIALSPSVVTLRASLRGDRQPGTSLVIDWQQVSGQETLTVSNRYSLNPTVAARLPGFYNFIVSVTEGVTLLQSMVNLDVYDARPAGGDSPLEFDAPFVLFDGIVYSWNSKPGFSYTLGVRRDLNDNFWVLVDRDIPSQGDVTYWVDYSGLFTTKNGFFTIFEFP